MYERCLNCRCLRMCLGCHHMRMDEAGACATESDCGLPIEVGRLASGYSRGKCLQDPVANLQLRFRGPQASERNRMSRIHDALRRVEAGDKVLSPPEWPIPVPMEVRDSPNGNHTSTEDRHTVATAVAHAVHPASEAYRRLPWQP